VFNKHRTEVTKKHAPKTAKMYKVTYIYCHIVTLQSVSAVNMCSIFLEGWGRGRS